VGLGFELKDFHLQSKVIIISLDVEYFKVLVPGWHYGKVVESLRDEGLWEVLRSLALCPEEDCVTPAPSFSSLCLLSHGIGSVAPPHAPTMLLSCHRPKASERIVD
jgi:hypothetical protein